MYPKVNADSAREGVNPSPSFPNLEEQVLAYWQKDGTFQASIDQRKAENAEEFLVLGAVAADAAIAVAAPNATLVNIAEEEVARAVAKRDALNDADTTWEFDEEVG